MLRPFYADTRYFRADRTCFARASAHAQDRCSEALMNAIRGCCLIKMRDGKTAIEWSQPGDCGWNIFESLSLLLKSKRVKIKVGCENLRFRHGDPNSVESVKSQ